ncbi:MAG: hypothetical protein KIS67_00150 [Verrucomicrobiae bacterium]|nr:hypothetical protein [Verrucomicrobiae bacterium]
MKAPFLNVDLDIESTSKLGSLVVEMGKRVVVLHSGRVSKSKRNLLRLESAGEHNGPDATIHGLCKVVESLSPAARRVWDAARKEFNVGHELRRSERDSFFSLRSDTLARIAKLGAKLVVTYYRGESKKGVEPV